MKILDVKKKPTSEISISIEDSIAKLRRKEGREPVNIMKDQNRRKNRGTTRK